MRCWWHVAEQGGCFDAALAYARRGWPVLPLHGVRADGSCGCGERGCDRTGKHPLGRLVPRGVKDATNDVATIRAWWTAAPWANLGIATGAVSGVVVLDVDRARGGGESLTALEVQHDALPATLRSRTGSGGDHLAFAHPGGVVPNRVNLAPGLDVRGDGGYIVAPPSVNANGPYVWAVGEATRLAEMPAWLLSLVRDDGARANASTVHSGNSENTDGDASPELPSDWHERLASDPILCGYWTRQKLLNGDDTSMSAYALAIANRVVREYPGDTDGQRLAILAAFYRHHAREKPLTALRLTLQRAKDAGGGATDGAASAGALLTFKSGPSIYAVTSEHIATCDVGADFLLDGLLVRKQVALLASIPKGGKSTLTTAIVRDLLRGAFCLDRKTHLQPDEDIIWLVEEPRAVFLHRLVREFRIHQDFLGTRLLVAYRREFRGEYDWQSYTKELTAQLATRQQRTGHRLGLIVVDTFGAWTGLDGDDEQRSGPVLRAFEPIYQLAEATGAAMLVNHHSRKGGGRDGRAVRGSTAITGGVDTIVELDRGRNMRRSIRELRVLGRLQETCWSARFNYDLRTCEYTRLSGDGDDSSETAGDAMPDTHRRALTRLAEVGEGGMLRSDLVGELKLSPDQAKKLFSAFKEGGLARLTGTRKSQRWFITDGGRGAVGAK